MCSNRIHLAIDRPKVHSCADFPLEEATTACFSATLVVRGRSQDIRANSIGEVSACPNARSTMGCLMVENIRL
jgi:hypothetical protein